MCEGSEQQEQEVTGRRAVERNSKRNRDTKMINQLVRGWLSHISSTVLAYCSIPQVTKKKLGGDLKTSSSCFSGQKPSGSIQLGVCVFVPQRS